MVEQLIGDIRRALECRMYAVALVGALTLPDICAAKDAPDGRASKERYIAWFKQQGCRPDGTFCIGVTFEDIYNARCDVLHQGLARHNGKRRPIRWRAEDEAGNETFYPSEPVDWSGNAIGLSLPGVCEILCLAAERWLEKEGGG